MKIYTREFDSALGQIKQIETEMDVMFRSAVETIDDLPSSENVSGDLRLVLDVDHLYAYVNSEWVDQGAFDYSDLVAERLMQGLS